MSPLLWMLACAAPDGSLGKAPDVAESDAVGSETDDLIVETEPVHTDTDRPHSSVESGPPPEESGDTDAGPPLPHPRCVYPGPFGPGQAYAFTSDHTRRALMLTDHYDGWVHLAPGVDMDGDGRRDLTVRYALDGSPYVERLVSYDAPDHGEVPSGTAEVAALESRDREDHIWAYVTTGDIDDDGEEDVSMLVELGWYPDPVTLQARAWRPFIGTKSFEHPDWTFSNPTWEADPTLANVQLADWTGDGKTDIYISSNYEYITGFDSVFLHGPIQPGVVDLTASPMAGGHSGDFDAPGFELLAGDLNGDGFNEFANATWGDGNGELDIFFGPIDRTFDPTSPDAVIRPTRLPDFGYPVEFGLDTISPGDIDGDGTDDLIVMSKLSADFSVLSGTAYIFLGPIHPGEQLDETDAHAWFSWVHDYAYLEQAEAAGDLDGNGKADFVLGLWGARSDLEPPGRRIPVLPLPGHSGDTGDTAVETDLPAAGSYPFWSAQGAIVAFSDPPPGELTPDDALFIIKGPMPGADATYTGLQPMGDLDGDGFPDLAWLEQAEDGFRVQVVFPCADYGTRAP